MENMSGIANGVFILPKPSPGTKLTVLSDTNGRSVSKRPPGKTPPIKPPKKDRSPDDDREILRCKRRIQFAGRLGVLQQRNPKQMAKRNERERNRVRTINSTFEMLQTYLPPGYIEPKPKNKKMSKVEILKGTIDYIRNLQELLADTDHLNAGALMMLPPGHLAQQPPQQLHHHHPPPSSFNPAGYYPYTPMPEPVMTDNCSPNSTYSTSSSETFVDGPLTIAMPSATASANTYHNDAMASPPMTPEDEQIIMEWLHDQRS